MKITPRLYQEYDIQEMLNFVCYGAHSDYSSALVCAPTGVGKSIEIAGLVDRCTKVNPNMRILMLTHRKELVHQNYEKATSMCEVPIGLWHAGLRKKEYDHAVVFAGIDTVANNPELLGWRDLVIIDEAHRVAPQKNTDYQKVFDVLKNINPNIKAVGLTATAYRVGQGCLTKKWYDKKAKTFIDPFWWQIIRDNTTTSIFNWFFAEGYLKRLVTKAPNNEIDVSTLRVDSRTKDYKQSDVDQQLNNEEKISAFVDEICEHGFERKSWLVFAAGNKNAELMAKEIESRGVTTAVITDKTKSKDRERILADFKAYKIRCLVNNDILTTGFDHAGVDLIAVVRVTTSTPLWVQMLGRGTRPVYAEGYDLSTAEGRLASMFASEVYNCLVLDFAGNSKRLGAINDPVKPKPPHEKSSVKGDCPLKVCGNEECRTYCYASQRNCPECGYAFPFSALLKTVAGSDELIVEQEHVPDIRRLAVTSIKFDSKKFTAANTTTMLLRIVYNCGNSGRFVENLNFSAKPTRRTVLWWKAFGSGEMPSTNDDFMRLYSTRSLIRDVRTIDVYMNQPKKSKPEIICYAFKDGTTFDTNA